MATQEPSLFALNPPGYPGAFKVGPVVNLLLFIPGEPVAKGRHRSRVVVPKGGGKPWVQTYTPEATTRWEEEVAQVAMEQIRAVPVSGTSDEFFLPFKGRLLISLRFNFHKPKSYPSSVVNHVVKPDVDNLAKAVLDGLQKARIIEDDNHVTDLSISKRYESDGHPEGVEIDLTAFE